ncbi:NAD-dependent epimerase/dehydratase family protein [Seleniivibrio sp.]|uniref:NAD-dependent epimerase/dehydratase family protein n=1 Tax=Seleniivibrio sp. TaxID=2898801 RepID=UPI0025DB3293|nr:NAD-dependent epimerase/dehydratase family protein [Seleniivibrio sp.]MCD8554274.1 NAD-dependent epimerase/dehydratase family protein [Seleniivibrio sp.]
MNILITGGCGFVGSSLALNIKQKYPKYEVTALDNLHRNGSELNIPILHEAGINFIQGDVRRPEDLEPLSYDLMIEASAEPSVMAGLNGDDRYLMETNFGGLFNCVRSVLDNNAKLIFLSTSRIFPMSAINGLEYIEEASRYTMKYGHGIAENFPKEGTRSLYGMSKYAGELLIAEYIEMLGLKAIINRCGLLAGKGQFGKTDQGVVTHWAASYIYDKQLSIFGNGKQVRDILNVRDLFRLIDMQIHSFDRFRSELFNIGGGINNSLSIFELDALCKKLIGAKEVPFMPERVLDIKYYVTDNTKIQSYGWSPEISAEETLKEIADWITENKEELKWIFA